MARKSKPDSILENEAKRIVGPRTVGEHLEYHGWRRVVATVNGQETVRWTLPGDSALLTTSKAWSRTMTEILGASVYDGHRTERSYAQHRGDEDVESF